MLRQSDREWQPTVLHDKWSNDIVRAILVQVWSSPGGFQEFEATRISIQSAHEVERLSALHTGRIYPPENIPGTHQYEAKQ
jgi:hypothetical protein